MSIENSYKRELSSLYIYEVDDIKGKVIIITDQDDHILWIYPPVFLRSLIGKPISNIHGRWEDNMAMVYKSGQLSEAKRLKDAHTRA